MCAFYSGPTTGFSLQEEHAGAMESCSWFSVSTLLYSAELDSVDYGSLISSMTAYSLAINFYTTVAMTKFIVIHSLRNTQKNTLS